MSGVVKPSNDLQDTLDAIDQLAVHECGYCRTRLSPASESLDYCDDECQAAWLSERHEVQELIGYKEPCDLPVHASRLAEMYSPEVTPDRPDDEWEWRSYSRSLTFELRVDTSSFARAMERFEASVRRLWEPIPEDDRVLARLLSGWVSFPARQNGRSRRGLTAGWTVFDELGPIGVVINSLRVAAPEPEVVVEQDEPPFGSDFDFEQTPAKSLPHEPLPAVIPAVLEQDWQALIDSQSGSYQTPDRFRRPFGRGVR